MNASNNKKDGNRNKKKKMNKKKNNRMIALHSHRQIHIWEKQKMLAEEMYSNVEKMRQSTHENPHRFIFFPFIWNGICVLACPMVQWQWYNGNGIAFYTSIHQD